MNKLAISKDLSLPLDAVTETFWFLGKRGSGKTHNASVFVEEMLAVQAQVIVLDPMSAWWGLRSSVDGNAPGFPIPIFGGAHADVPLESTAGQYMADLAIGEGVSMILDVKDWSKAERCRFVTAFLTRLLAKNRDPCHVVLEEADVFAPQRPSNDETKMLAATEGLVRRGRGSGLGCTLISQRSASVNKEVTTQTEVLVAHRIRGPQDAKAAEEWFKAHDPDQVAGLARRLSALATGTALVTSTDLLDFIGDVTFRARKTFDSSATPKVGEKRRKAKTLADVDLGAIETQMAETIERAKADDPKALRARIKQLERDLAAKPATETETIEVEVVRDVEVPVFDEDLVIRLEEALQPASGVLAEIQERLTWATKQTDDMIEMTRILNERTARRPTGRTEQRPQSTKPQVNRNAPRNTPTVTDLGKGETRILTAIAQHPDGVTRPQLSALTDYKRSSRDTYLQRLKAADLIEQHGDRIHVTDAGLDTLGDFEPLPTGRALQEYWLTNLPAGEGLVLEHLLAHHPQGLSRDRISEMTEYKRSSRDTYIQRLRAKELVVVAGEIFAADHLFEDGND